MGDKHQLPPGNFGLPWIGEFLDYTKNPYEFIDKRIQQFGSIFKTKFLGKPFIFFADQQSLAKLSEEYFQRKGAALYLVKKILGEEALPFRDGKAHLKIKKIVLEALSGERLKIHFEKSIVPITEAFLARWKKSRNVALNYELKKLFFTIIHSILIGPNAISSENIFNDLITLKKGFFSIPISFPGGQFKKSMDARRRICAYLLEITKKRRQHPQDYDTISYLCQAQKRADTGFLLTDNEIVNECLHLFVGSTAPLNTAGGYVIVVLDKHSEVRERIYKEITDNHINLLDYNCLKTYDYLDCVFKETIRYYPVIPHTQQYLVKKTTEIGGYEIPKGWFVMGVLYSKNLWNEEHSNQNTFDPDRFYLTHLKNKQAENSFVAFGIGSSDNHRCAGEKLATIIMKFLIGKLVMDYPFSLNETPILSQNPKIGLDVISPLSATFK